MPKDPPDVTPVPNDTLLMISSNLAAVASGVKTIKEDLIPPIAKDTREARDTAREAIQKIDSHLSDNDTHTVHACVDKDRQGEQDKNIAENRIRLAGVTRFLWFLIPVVLGIGGSAIGFALVVKGDASEAATKLRDLDGLDDDVARHDVRIQAIEKAQAKDRSTFIKEVRALPTKVEEIASKRRDPTLDEMGDITEDLPLTTRERRVMDQILSNAKQRAGSSKHVP